MRRRLSFLLVVVMMLSMLTACGTKNEDKTTSKNDSNTAGKVEEKQADIVVIGAGGAGMSAAIQAVGDGATNVVILEKMAQVGGNTTRATGGLNASETKYQKADGIKDSNELFIEDTMKGGNNLNDKELVTVLAKNSSAAVDWVNEIGGDLSVVGMFGGASVKRIHRPSDTSAVGPMLVKTFSKKLEELKIPVMLETTAEEIVVDKDGKVTGVKAKNADGEMIINCKSVVLATGGFGANLEMVTEYKADLKGFGTTNHAGATGDGIILAKKVGATFVDMDQIQIHPTVDPKSQTLITEGVRGNGAILVNKEGKRYINELLTRDVVSAAMLEQTDGESYLIFDEEVRKSLTAIESYFSYGLVIEADTVEELAKKTGMDEKAFAETMKNYASYQKAGKDAEFDREDMTYPLTESKFYAILCTPAIHHTMGGVKINTSAEVLKEDGSAVSGLFAAGEVTGGVHGANRLGGNAVADIVVYGRIAGSSAYSYLEKNGGNTEATIKVEAAEEEVKPEVQGNFKDGVYTGTGKGNGGDITVEVTVEDSNITKVTVTAQTETPGIYEGAESGVTSAIIKKQTTEVDVVTGATNSSNGIKEAVANALKDATK